VQLSGGEQQRVALARALACAPSLLLLDEPLSALDARVRARLGEEIRALQRRLRITTVMVTHDQEEALAMADRIVVMNRGRVEQVGTPVEIYARPATAFVADFVGTMNVFDAEIIAPGRVRLGALLLDCPAAGDKRSGERVKLGFRPEDVRIRAVEAGLRNAIAVGVEEVAFLGPFCRAGLRPLEDRSLRLRCDFSANALRDLEISAGKALTIVLPAEALRVFDAKKDGA